MQLLVKLNQSQILQLLILNLYANFELNLEKHVLHAHSLSSRQLW